MIDNPAIASQIAAAGSRANDVKKAEWAKHCNGDAMIGYTPQGTRPHMGDELTCIALANVFQCVDRLVVNVHTKSETLIFRPFEGASYVKIHLAYYWAPQWKHLSTQRLLKKNATELLLTKLVLLRRLLCSDSILAWLREPWGFYRVLAVPNNADVEQIVAAQKRFLILYHPDKHDCAEKDAWTAQFQILPDT